MSRQLSMAAQFPPVELLNAATDAAGRTGAAYASLANCSGKAWIVAKLAQGNAAQVTFSVVQAKDKSGTGSKAINASAGIWLNADTSLGDALVAQAAAASLQLSAALKNKIVIFEIIPERDMDIAGGFNHIQITTSASNAGNITSADVHIYGAYQQATPPTTAV